MDAPSGKDSLKWRRQEQEAFVSGNTKQLCESLLEQARLLKDPDQKAGTLYRAACAAERAGDLDRAVEVLSRVVDSPLWERLALLTLIEVHWTRQEWRPFVQALDKELSMGSGLEERIIRLEKARVLAFRLGLTEDALREIAAVLEQDPGCREALWLRLALALRSGEWQGVTENYKALIELARQDPDPTLATSSAFRLGQVYEHRFQDPPQAAGYYEQACADEGALLSVTPLKEMAEQAGDWKKAAEHLERMVADLEHSSGEAPPVMRIILARMKKDLVDDRQGFVNQVRGLLEKEPHNLEALYMAAQEAIQHGTPEERADLDMRLCRVVEDNNEIAYFTADRVRVLLDDIGDPAGAAESAAKWKELQPADPAPHYYLIESLDRAEKHGEAVDAIKGRLEAATDPRELQALYIKSAELCAYRLSDRQAALQAYRKALEITPSQFPVLVSMARLYHREGDFENLARAITASVKLVQDKALRRFMQSWLADLYLERLASEDQAFAIWGEILKADQDDYQALKFVERISSAKGSWKNAAGAMARLVQKTGDPRLAGEMKAGLAWLYEFKQGDMQKAEAIYRELAEEDHDFALESLRRLAYTAREMKSYAEQLQRMVERSDNQEIRASLLVRVAGAEEILGELDHAWAAYEKARASLGKLPHLYLAMIDLAQLSGYWARYISLIEEFAARLSSPNQRALLWEAAWSRAEVPGPQGNIEPGAMHKAFKHLEESAGEGQDSLRGAWLASIWAGDHAASADLMARLIKAVPDDLADALRIRLAYVLRDRLGAAEESIAALRQALSRHQRSIPLIRELELMYEAGGQWSELVRMMLLEIPLREDAEVLVHMYTRLAGIYEEQWSALDEAIKCHQAIIRMVPARLESHSELVRLLEARSRWEELAAALTVYQDAAPEPEKKIQLLYKAAQVCDEKLSDPDRSIERLKMALDLDPTRDETLTRLSAIYEREERWQELVQVLMDQAQRVEQSSDKAALNESIADIQERRLDDRDAAIEHLVIARDLDPERRSVLLSLERLFEAAQRYEELIDTLERLASGAEQQERIDYFARIGTLWDEKLGQPENSIASWERVRELDKSHLPAMESLVSLYERTGDHQKFVERSGELAELVVDDVSRAVELLSRAGAVLEEKIEDDERALGFFHRAMEVSPSDPGPVSLARAVREKRGEWSQVVDLWLREEQITEDVDRKVEIFAQVGNIYETRLEDEDKAAASYHKALELKADYLPAVEPLSEIYYKHEAWDKARPLFEIRAGALDGAVADQSAEILFKAGWCAEKTEDVDTAMARFHSSIEAMENYRPSLARLSELYANQENWEQTAIITEKLLQVVKVEQDWENAFALLHRHGSALTRLERLDQAVEAYEEALTIKPGHYDTLTYLVELYQRTERWKKALTAYDQLIRNAPSKEAAAEGLAGKGIVLEDRLSEEQSALAHFQKAVELNPDHLVCWQRLSGIYLGRKAWQEAEQALARLVEIEPDEKLLVGHHYNLGYVYKEGMADLSRAREQFESALAMDEAHVPSMEALGDIYLEQEEWEKFIQTSEKFVKLLPPEKQPSLVPLYFKMAQVYRDHINNKERAIIQLQQVIKHQPDNEQARSELAALYVSDPKFMDQAKAENINLIRLHPFRVQTYRDLAQIYKQQGNLDALFNIYAILKFSGSLDYEEEMFYEANQSKIITKSNKSLREVEREGMLVHQDERGPLHEMLIIMGEHLQKLFPPPINRYGAKKSNLLTEKSESPVKDLAAEMSGNLGLEDLNIYLVTQNIEPQVFHTTPPSLVINAQWLQKFDEKEQRFIMGRAIMHLLSRHPVVLHNPPEKVLRTLCFIAMAAEPSVDFPVPGVSADDLDKEKKNAKKLIPRKVKTQVEHAAQRFSKEIAEIDPQSWLQTVKHTGNRAGLLVCGDLPTAFAAIIKTDPQYKNVRYDSLEDKTSIWEKHPEAVELLAFAVSDPYFRLRERLGMSITGR